MKKPRDHRVKSKFFNFQYYVKFAELLFWFWYDPFSQMLSHIFMNGKLQLYSQLIQMTKMTYLEFTAYFTIEFATFFKRKLSSCEISCAQRSPWRFQETPRQLPSPIFITHQADMPRWQAEMTNRLAMTQWQSQCQSQLDSSLETLALRGDICNGHTESLRFTHFYTFSKLPIYIPGGVTLDWATKQPRLKS